MGTSPGGVTENERGMPPVESAGTGEAGTSLSVNVLLAGAESWINVRPGMDGRAGAW